VEGQQVVDVMVAAKLLPTKSEVRRMIKGGGVYLNNQKVGRARGGGGAAAPPRAGGMPLLPCCVGGSSECACPGAVAWWGRGGEGACWLLRAGRALQVSDDKAVVAGADMIESRLLLLAAGKKNKMLVRIV
jgi:hypothetical protein